MGVPSAEDVEFGDAESVMKALALNGIAFKGQPLLVQASMAVSLVFLLINTRSLLMSIIGLLQARAFSVMVIEMDHAWGSVQPAWRLSHAEYHP